MAKNKPTFHECKVCGLIVKHSWGLSDHMKRRHTNDRPYLCDSCPKSFPKQYELKRHYVIHTGEKPYKCSICSESFRSRISKNIHEDSHGVLRHKCDYCDSEFYHRDEKHIHQKKAHHTGSGSKFECNECYKVFGNEKFLMLHKKEHSGYNIQCPYCPLTFSKMHEFKIHERSHMGIKRKRGRRMRTPHMCHICNETFRLKYDIIRHFSKFHPADKATVFHQKCRYCEKVFSTKNHLNQHLVSHSDERNFPCSKCDYKAKRQRDLDIHEINLHARKGLHQCQYCEKSFPVISMYKSHVNKHENHRGFQCQLCDKAYYSQRQLRDHTRTHSEKSEVRAEKELCPLCGKLLAATFMPRHLKNHEYENNGIEKPKRERRKKPAKDILEKNMNPLQEFKVYYGFECKKCTLPFLSKLELNIHQENCTKKLCTYCKTVFVNDIKCQQHINKYHKDKLYQCLICQKKFRNSVYLISHKLSHQYQVSDNSICNAKQTVETGYYFECFACGKLCSSESTLNLHVKIHKIRLRPVRPRSFPSISDEDIDS